MKLISIFAALFVAITALSDDPPISKGSHGYPGRVRQDPHEPAHQPGSTSNFFAVCQVDGGKFRLYQREGRVFVEGTYYSRGPCEIVTDSKNASQRFSCPLADSDEYRKVTVALNASGNQCQTGKWEATLVGKKNKKVACEPYPG